MDADHASLHRVVVRRGLVCGGVVGTGAMRGAMMGLLIDVMRLVDDLR